TGCSGGRGRGRPHQRNCGFLSPPRQARGVSMAEEVFAYDEADRSATITLKGGRPFKLSNVSRERAEAFFKRLQDEAAAMAARGAPGDPLTFTGPGCALTRGL